MGGKATKKDGAGSGKGAAGSQGGSSPAARRPPAHDGAGGVLEGAIMEKLTLSMHDARVICRR